MLSLDDRIKLLKDDLIADPPSFVMTRELPFAIFRYDPHIPAESEWIVRRKIQLLGTQVENETHQHVATVSMASLFWRSIQESEDVAGLIALEHDHSYAVAERQVNQYLSDPDFRPLCDLLREEETKLPPNTRALFLTHATVFGLCHNRYQEYWYVRFGDRFRRWPFCRNKYDTHCDRSARRRLLLRRI